MPESCAGYENGSLHSLEIPNLDSCTRQDVRDYFNNTWTLTEVLFSALQNEEAFYRPPYHSLRHPMIFYYGHPAVLYINKLVMAGVLSRGINSYFEDIFQTGVDEMSWDDMSKNDMMWPAIEDVLSYRKQAYRTIMDVIETHPGLADGHPAVDKQNPLWSLFMGFEHERIHIETSSVLMRELPLHLVSSPEQWPAFAAMPRLTSVCSPASGVHYPKNEFITVPEGAITYGKPESWPTYGWDNEYGRRSVYVPEFCVSSLLISNGEYREFVEAGGYEDKTFWTETGWRWRSFRNSQSPTFWTTVENAGMKNIGLRTCFEVVPMQWDWPVVVNFHEAKAFCNWKSSVDGRCYRLVTEAEHQSLRRWCNLQTDSQRQLMVPQQHNINLRWGGESPVDFYASSQSGQIFDLFGNVWQWCEDHFSPLAGSQTHPLYDDFSTPCYDGEHQMIMGGSFISTGDEATPWARFHFRPHFFQHAGFRIVYSTRGSSGAPLLITK